MTLRILHITDTHIGPNPDHLLYGYNTYQHSLRLVDYINNELPFQPDLVLHTGDVCYDPDPIAAKLAFDVLGKIKYPLYVVRGNHDDPDALRDYFPNLPSDSGRINYDFVINDYHFIVLDSFGRVQPAGYLAAEQLEWLASTLQSSTATSVVMVVHHLPVMTGNLWLDERMRIENQSAFFDVLEPYQARIRGLFFGHIHIPSTHVHRGILCSSAPAAFSQFIMPNSRDEQFTVTEPGGFSLVTLSHSGVTVLHHQLGDNDGN